MALKTRLGVLMAAIVIAGSLGLSSLSRADDDRARSIIQSCSLPATVRLNRGRWIVLLYKSSCGDCQAAAADYADLARKWKSEGRTVQVALIDADPQSGVEKTWLNPEVAAGALESTSLYGSGPEVVVLSDGRIAAVEKDPENIDWNSSAHAGWIK